MIYKYLISFLESIPSDRKIPIHVTSIETGQVIAISNNIDWKIDEYGEFYLRIQVKTVIPNDTV